MPIFSSLSLWFLPLFFLQLPTQNGSWRKRSKKRGGNWRKKNYKGWSCFLQLRPVFFLQCS